MHSKDTYFEYPDSDTLWTQADEAEYDYAMSATPDRDKRRNRRRQDKLHKNYLKILCETEKGYPCPVVYTDRIYIRGQGFIDNPSPYYKRIYRRRASKYLKKQSHRAVRRYKGELKNGCISNRIFDFWWELD